MLIREVTKKGFILAYKPVSDFCKSVEKTQGKCDHIYMCCDGEMVIFYSTSPLAVVTARGRAEKGVKFSCGVDAVRFITLFKKLSSELDILMTPSKSTLLIEQANVNVKFPVVDYVAETSLPKFVSVSGSPAFILAADIGRCYESIGPTQRFPGVVIDNSLEKVMRISKYSDTAMRTTVLPNIPEIGSRKWVIAPEMAKALRTLQDEIEQILFGENHFGVLLRSGTLFYMPLLHDSSYPGANVTEKFSIQNEMKQITKSRRSYAFSGEQLQAVLDLVASVAGSEESHINIEIDGVEGKSGCPVWKVSTKTLNGCTATESIVARAPVEDNDMVSCSIHKTRALASLKLYGDDIIIHDINDVAFAITDGDGADVTILMKGAW